MYYVTWYVIEDVQITAIKVNVCFGVIAGINDVCYSHQICSIQDREMLNILAKGILGYPWFYSTLHNNTIIQYIYTHMGCDFVVVFCVFASCIASC